MLKGEGWYANHTVPHVQSVSLVDLGEQKEESADGRIAKRIVDQRNGLVSELRNIAMG